MRRIEADKRSPSPSPFNVVSLLLPAFPSVPKSLTVMSATTLELVDDWPAFIQNPIQKIDEFLRGSDVAAGSLLEHHVRISDSLSHLPLQQLTGIPSFNDVNRLENKSLVRFRCMVQDMFDPEFYLARFETRNKETGERGTGYGMYRDSFADSDVLDVNYDSASNAMQDRMTYLCIAIPGENDWVGEKQAAKSEVREAEPMDSSVLDDSATPSTDQPMSSGDQNVKRFKPDREAAAEIRTKLSQCFPSIDSSAKKLALVKIYDTRELTLKLNDMIEVIGIMDIGDGGADATGEKKPESEAAVAGAQLDENNFSLPAVVAPQIHALYVQKLHHLNPLVGDSCCGNAAAAKTKIPSPDPEFCEKMRKELHAVLSLCLFGDELAAEYLICCLISRIYSRQEILSLGSLTVGFSNLPRSSRPEIREYVKSLYQLISSLVTHSVYLPMSLETLNGRSFIPKKDHSCNKLVSGRLQLAPETLLFVDETALEPGKLEEQGLANLKSLGELIKWQQLKYDFEYHAMEVNTDMKIMVFSEGKSLLPLNFRIPLEVPNDVSTERVMEAVREYLDQRLRDQIRGYLTRLRDAEYQIPAAVQKQIQDDFVEMRQMDSKKVTADSLHALLTLSRLMSISRGDRELSLETWDHVMRLEAARQARQSAA